MFLRGQKGSEVLGTTKTTLIIIQNSQVKDIKIMGKTYSKKKSFTYKHEHGLDDERSNRREQSRKECRKWKQNKNKDDYQ